MTDTDQLPAHSKRGPSGANGWLECLDYVNANEGLFNDESEPAAEGTVAHSVSDMCFTLDMEPSDFIGMRTRYPYKYREFDPNTASYVIKDGVYDFEWTADDAEFLQPGIDKIRNMRGMFYGERKVDLSKWLGEGQFGTLDRAVVKVNPETGFTESIYIGDLKYGRGIPVSPVKNWQLILYALGFCEWWLDRGEEFIEDAEIILDIDQPRHPAGGGEWPTTPKELEEYGEWIRQRVDEANQYGDKAPRTPTVKGCQWCRARLHENGGCKEYDEWMWTTTGAKFDDLDEPETIKFDDVGDLTPERRAEVVQRAPLIKKWLENIAEVHLNQCMIGQPGGGLKAVHGRKSPDKWEDKTKAEEAVRARLGDKGFSVSVKTPKQIRDMVDDETAKEFRPLVIIGERKPTLVSEDDAREAISNAQSKFDEEES